MLLHERDYWREIWPLGLVNNLGFAGHFSNQEIPRSCGDKPRGFANWDLNFVSHHGYTHAFGSKYAKHYALRHFQVIKTLCQPLFTKSDRDKTQSTVLIFGGIRTGTCCLRGCCADGQASCTSCLSTWTTSSTHYSGKRWDLHFAVNKNIAMLCPPFFRVKKLSTVQLYMYWILHSKYIFVVSPGSYFV